jgi:S1-C subfamily serine protease
MHRIVLTLMFAFCACGGPTARAPQSNLAAAAPSPLSSSSPAPEAPAHPADSLLSRAAVHAVVVQGLGAFLQHVELDEHPVFVGGKFHGFRIVALNDPAFWRGVDLRPGDVITGVNGFPIERPEQAVSVFDSLELASELRVAYDRDGQPRELVYSIADDR